MTAHAKRETCPIVMSCDRAYVTQLATALLCNRRIEPTCLLLEVYVLCHNLGRRLPSIPEYKRRLRQLRTADEREAGRGPSCMKICPLPRNPCTKGLR